MYYGGMAQYRKEALTTGNYYHIFSRSIVKFVVFNKECEYDRFYQLINLCRFTNFVYKYSRFNMLSNKVQAGIIDNLKSQNDCLVEIVVYCIMPTHIHLVLKQVKDGGITKFMARVLNGYTRYFNSMHKRTGPLWSGRFKSVLVNHDEQLLHLTRYIHLNPVSSGLVENPEDWSHSSYLEYSDRNMENSICVFDKIISLGHKEYEKFVRDHKANQKELSEIKYLTIDDYSG